MRRLSDIDKAQVKDRVEFPQRIDARAQELLKDVGELTVLHDFSFFK
jgi:hypothetical protein